MALEFRWLTLSTGYWAVVFCFYFTSLWFRCIYSISPLVRGLPMNIPRVLSLYIFIPYHSLRMVVERHAAISRKSCTSTYKGILCHFGVTDGGDIDVDTFQHLDFFNILVSALNLIGYCPIWFWFPGHFAMWASIPLCLIYSMTLYSCISLWWMSLIIHVLRIYHRIYDESPLEDVILKDKLPGQVSIPGICRGNVFSRTKRLFTWWLALIIHYHFENESCF